MAEVQQGPAPGRNGATQVDSIGEVVRIATVDLTKPREYSRLAFLAVAFFFCHRQTLVCGA